ncbi:MAG: hypothetical protein HFH26_00865 [Clostridiaceae bacterium]|nr:hypothetical protein [Clostridiaceae bacterium]
MISSQNEAVTKGAVIAGDGNPSLDTTPLEPTMEDQLDQIRTLLEQMMLLAERSAEEGMPDRELLQQELDRLRGEIDEIADQMDG